jgi:hypothetical protein
MFMDNEKFHTICMYILIHINEENETSSITQDEN